MRYYDLKRNWTKRVMPHLGDEELNRILKHDFDKFIFGRWSMRLEPGKLPLDYESCDWYFNRRGPMPRYWRYVKHAACHWLVNFNQRLAQLAEPDRAWLVVSGRDHSTVWDGDQTLFDINGSALRILPDQAWAMANRGEVIVGDFEPHYAGHYSDDLRGEYLEQWWEKTHAEGG